MNKKQLVTKISSTLGQSKADAERTFDSITTIILDALKNDDTVKIAGFGTYKVAKRKARVGRNPRKMLILWGNCRNSILTIRGINEQKTTSS